MTKDLATFKDDKITHYAITFTGVHYPLTFARYQAMATVAPDEEFNLDGNLLKRKNIADLLTVEKYKETHADKAPTNYNPLARPLQTFEDIADAFAWTGYGNMLELITLTHSRLREWKGTFEEFCKKHKALSPKGDICTFKFIDKKGNRNDAIFAYPFFSAVYKLVQSRDGKRDFAESMNILTDQEAEEFFGQAGLPF